jgi:RimJ/RimL family protein N-acetyltransferase
MADVIAETARLRLRTWDEADIAPFMAALNTPAVMQWLGGVQSEAEFRAAYDRIQACQAEHGHCFWIVERRSDDRLLGFCGLKRVNSEGAPMPGDFEIGWRLREDAQGFGYAREAAEMSLSLAFTRYHAPHVVALTVRENAASWGLMMRLGMIRARAWDFTGSFGGGGPAYDVITYKIDKEDWTQ